MVSARADAVQPASYLTNNLPAQLPPIFEQAQHTTANHRKNIVALRKIQVACATVTEETSKGTKLVGEKAFNTLFVNMVNVVLGVKKGVAVADRVVKFVANYVAYTTEQGECSCQDKDRAYHIADQVDMASRPEGEEDVDTAATRFVNRLLKHLLSGMEAKDKNVRFRVTLLTVSMINGLGEMESVGLVPIPTKADLAATMSTCCSSGVF
jgi:condensin complex subunit 3